jgi:hypothetical protein
MAIIRGPFEIKWGDNIISDVEELDIEHEIATDDFETIQGKTYELDGNYKVTATLTLLASDLPILAALLPQHWIPNGGIMSTGETVNYAYGAIDVAPHDCDAELIHNNLDIISCANPANVLRVVSARTKLEGIEIDNKVQKVMVKFIGEANSDEATVQFFKQGTINVVS